MFSLPDSLGDWEMYTVHERKREKLAYYDECLSVALLPLLPCFVCDASSVEREKEEREREEKLAWFFPALSHTIKAHTHYENKK